MILSIDHAIDNLYKLHQRTQSPKMQASLDMAISALMTIKDGNYKLQQEPPVPNKDVPPAIDLKTLYEQTTMYCDLIATSSDYQYQIEIYQQPNTPIKIFVYWSKKHHTIISINYSIPLYQIV